MKRKEEPIFDFFASPETISKLQEASQAKVLLIGSFAGYWNFGDIMQLLGVVRWHQTNQPGHVVCPFVDKRTISSNEELALLSNLFRTEHWLVYAPSPIARVLPFVLL